MFLEVFYAIGLNLSNFAIFIEIVGAFLLVFGFIMLGFAYFESDEWGDPCLKKDTNDDESKRFKGLSKFIFKYTSIAMFICAPFALIPDTDDLWKIRIGIIKLQLASPKNLEKGTEEISRIAKKLECKYLGGCEEEKPKEKKSKWKKSKKS